jgi:predicted amidophosphoribosyltransferase
MPSVRELSELYGNLMLCPRSGPGVCVRCFNLTDGYDRCYACTHCESVLEAVAPISYSVAHEQLHHALASYKRLGGEVSRRLSVQLAAVLWRYLDGHERCVARAAGAESFPVVTTVPSGDRRRDEEHPLRSIVGELSAPTRKRYERLLRRSAVDVAARAFDPQKYAAARPLTGEAILVIDDTWTTGANAQSAAAALKAAGAGLVAAVVIGRHINRDWGQNDQRLRALPQPFDWGSCAFCAHADGRSSGASSDEEMASTTPQRAPA